MNDGRSRTTLIVALLLVAALVYRLVELPASWTGEAFGFPAAAADVPELPAIAVRQINTQALALEAAEFHPGRDPFRFGAAPPPVAPPVAEPEKVAVVASPPQPLSTAPVSIEPPRPKPPPIDVKFLGSFGPEGRQIAVFSDGESLFNAFAGETVKEKFEVFQIGFESVDLTFVGFPEEPPARLAIGG